MKRGLLAWLNTAPREAPRTSNFPVHLMLPNPNSETTEDAAAATAATNAEIIQVLHTPEPKRGKKRKQYTYYSPEKRAKIAKFGLQHGASKAARHFSTADNKLGESTVRNFIKQLKSKMAADGTDFSDVKDLPRGNQGRPTLLPEQLDTKVQIHLMKLRQAGGVMGLNS